jgi:hypothetical protein
MTWIVERLECMEARMDATVWIELLVVILKLFASGLAG